MDGQRAGVQKANQHGPQGEEVVGAMRTICVAQCTRKEQNCETTTGTDAHNVYTHNISKHAFTYSKTNVTVYTQAMPLIDLDKAGVTHVPTSQADRAHDIQIHWPGHECGLPHTDVLDQARLMMQNLIKDHGTGLNWAHEHILGPYIRKWILHTSWTTSYSLHGAEEEPMTKRQAIAENLRRSKAVIQVDAAEHKDFDSTLKVMMILQCIVL